MKKTFTLIYTLAAAFYSFTQTIDIDQPKTYLPDFANTIKIGMGLKDFQGIKDTAQLERDISYSYLYTGFIETAINSPARKVTYKFDTPQNGKNNYRPLYEISFEFNDPAFADAYVNEKFTSYHRISEFAEKEWFLATNKDYWILIRKNQNFVTIAAMMSGTEWGFE